MTQCQYLNPDNGERCQKESTGDYTIALDGECGYDNFWCCTALCSKHGKQLEKAPDVDSKGIVK